MIAELGTASSVPAVQTSRPSTHSQGEIAAVLEGEGGEITSGAHGRIAVAGPPEFLRRVRESLAKRIAPLARTVEVEVTVRAGGDVVAGAPLTALNGRPALVRVGTDESMVSDHDVEVGCYVQIADPIVVTVFSGLFLRAVPRVAPDGRTVLVEFQGRVQWSSGPEVRPLGTVVCGSLQTASVESRVIDAELVLGAKPSRLQLGRAADGRPLELEVRATPE